MIAVIDYGRGNLYSLTSALKYLGIDFKLIDKAENVRINYNKIILPGVGAFGDAIKQLKSKNFINIIKECSDKEVPILGIC